MPELNRHALSKAFPSMSESEQDDLTSDIDQHGQREPITIYQDEVLDGWHRYQSCLTLGIEPKFIDLPEYVDAVSFVLSHNMHRRHLTSSQRAAAVVACNDWAQSGTNQDVIRTGELSSPVATVSEMAKAAGVSDRTIQQAKRAEEAGLGGKVRDGELTARKAAEMLKPPKPISSPTPGPENKPQEKLDAFPPQPEQPTELEMLRELVTEYQAEAEALEKILDADDKLTESVAEIKRLNAMNATIRSQLDGANNKNNELIGLVKSLKKQVARLEKELLQYQIEELPL